MKIYEEIRQILAVDQTAILFSEWEEGDNGEVKDLTQRVEVRDPETSKGRLEAEVFDSGKPVVLNMENHHVMAEPFFPEQRLIILGGGHVAVPLVEFAAKTGFAVTLVDDRPEFANSDRFPWAKHIVCKDFSEALCELKIRRSDYICILTRGHACDEDCLRVIFTGEEPAYLGMIGSRRRVAMVKERLLAEGISKERMDRLHSPIGLPIGGISPAEISISILAELIACRRVGDDKGNKTSQMDQDYRVVEALSGAEPIHGAVLTVISAHGSAPRGAGAKMIVYADGSILGSIGGGGGEAVAMGLANEIIGTGRSLDVQMSLTQDEAAAEGMVCGGSIRVLIQDIV